MRRECCAKAVPLWPNKGRHSPCPWQSETCDRGRARHPTLLGRGSHEEALPDSRSSQFRQARHKNLAWPKTRRRAPKFAARRIDAILFFYFAHVPWMSRCRVQTPGIGCIALARALRRLPHWLICKRLDLRFQSLPREIATCHSSLGGEFGEPRAALAPGEPVLRILDSIDSASPIMPAVR
jgi:hypothetical protein